MNQRPKTVADSMMRQAVIRAAKKINRKPATGGISYREMMAKSVAKIPKDK